MNKVNCLTDKVLLDETRRLVLREKEYTLLILEHLREIEKRSLFLAVGKSSLHHYCVHILGYTDGESALRISAMRLTKEVPQIAEKLKEGQLNLTQVGQLAGYMKKSKEKDSENSNPQSSLLPTEEKKPSLQEILKELGGKSTRETKKILDEKLGKPRESKVVLHIPLELQEKMNKLKEKYDIKDDVEILNWLCEEKLKEKSPTPKDQEIPDLEPCEVKNPHSSYIPLRLRRKIQQRSGGRCEKISPLTGERCKSRTRLQFHHLYPFAMGGLTTEDNVKHYCKACNLAEAKVFFGPLKVEQFSPKRFRVPSSK